MEDAKEKGVQTIIALFLFPLMLFATGMFWKVVGPMALCFMGLWLAIALCPLPKTTNIWSYDDEV
jgi:hypothetical protein